MGERSSKAGFTLIELMIVVAIIGVLATIAVPKLGKMIRSGNEAATKGKLGSVRGALNIYYGEQEGWFPTDLDPLLQPGSKYMTGVIPLWTQIHGNSNYIDYRSAPDRTLDTGDWGYANDPTGDSFGTLWIECTHTDLKGTAWSEY